VGIGNACSKGGGESGAGGIACSSAGGGEGVPDELRSDIKDVEVRLFLEPELQVPTARAIAARVAELELRREPGER
jgi:hypothetical protein